MRFSFARSSLFAAAVAASAACAVADAAPPRTAQRAAKATRAAYQAEEIVPPSPPAARPSRAAPSIEHETHHSFVPDEYAPHGHGHAFTDHSYHDECLGPNCKTCTAGPLYVLADYILWWRSGLDLPALVTTSPDGTLQADAGELGRGTTSTLFGGSEAEEYPTRPGGRVEAGWWLDPNECVGLAGRFYWLGDAEIEYAQSSTGSPILAIPFTEGQNNTVAARLVAFPGVFNGNLNFRSTSEIVGGDVYGRMMWCCTDWGHIDLTGGYQFARLNEGLTMDSTVSDTGGATNRLLDVFDTRNEFHGAQIGIMARIERCTHYIDLMARVGLGNMEQTVTIGGQSISTVGSTSISVPNSGLFAQPTNVGTFSRSEFSAIPELGINVGWCVTECIDVSCGYTMIYYSNVVRPGDAIDTTVNTSQAGGSTINGAARPAFTFTDSDLFLHGLHMGVTVKF